MIPPQLAILAAKYGKQLAIGLAVLIVISAIWFAVKMHERTVAQLAASEASRAAQVVAHETTIASLQVQREAASRWQASAQKYQETLDEQVRVRNEATRESRELTEAMDSGRLERMGRTQPALLERTVNRSTARIIGLLNCSSTASGCDGDREAPGPDASHPLPPAAGTRTLPVVSNGAGALERPRQSLLLSRPIGLRSSDT